jgi:phospholipase A1/A2
MHFVSRTILVFGLSIGAAAAQEAGIWEKRIEADARRESFTLTARKPNYILVSYMEQPNQAPYAFTGSTDRLENQEIKFQLSFQTKMGDDLLGGNGDLWFGYTQQSYWQLFNSAISAPFRETNYEPEVYFSLLTGYELLGLKLRSIDAGFVHQSNGRAEPLSRSWNRVFADFKFVRGDLALGLRPWLRVKEDPQDDNNPDIRDYLGSYELRAHYHWKGQTFSFMGRNLFDSDQRYNAELDWTFPIKGRLRGMVQWYKGYGESLIDYNYKMNRIGVGVMLTDWL